MGKLLTTMKAKKKLKTILLLFFLFIFLSCNSVVAQSSTNFHWVSIYFEVNQLLEEVTAKIKEVEKSIEKGKQISDQTNKIIRLAQQGDPEAKKNESRALALQQEILETTRKNEELLKQLQLKRDRAQRMMAYLQNMAKGGFVVNVKGMVSDFRGTVQIFKNNGQYFNPDDYTFGLLEEGDKIVTYGNSYARVKFLEGRAEAIADEFSELTMEKETDEEEILTLSKGKIYMELEKKDVFIDKTKKEYEKYKSTVPYDISSFEEEMRKVINKVLYLKLKNRSGNPTWVIGARGTRFLAENNAEGESVLSVLEDTVEVFLPKNETLAVPAGYKVIFMRDSVSQLQKIESIDEWWEKKRQ